MTTKNLSVIQGDTLTLGIRLSGPSGAIDLTAPDTRLYAHVSDMGGRRVLGRFRIVPADLANGYFQIHLESSTSFSLRGKNRWAVRFERGEHITKTLAGGVIEVMPGA